MLEKLGAQLYTVREYAKTPEDIRKAFQKVKKIGYSSVQVSGIGPIEAEKLTEISKETGLPIVCTHVPFKRMVEDLDRLIEEHKTYGCDYIGLGSMPVEYRDTQEGVREFIKIFNGVADKAWEKGMRIGYHNHSFEYVKVGGTRIMDMLISELSPEKVFFTLDTYWVQHGGADCVQTIKDLAGRIKMLHLKDMGIGPNGHFMAEIMEGNINFDGIIPAAEEAGVEWYLVEQDICPGNPFDSLKISFDNLKKWSGAR